jgi:nickel-dependent lactate racemase
VVIGKGYEETYLSEDEVRELIVQGFASVEIKGKRVVIIIPDSTRTAPLPLFFRLFHEVIGGQVAALDYLIALGTHPPMGEEAIVRLVGVTAEERRDKYAGINIFNHRWDLPDALTTIGTITADEIETITGGLMRQDVPITLNKTIFNYDLAVICGPVFPHEVVGFSAGNKYFFPGIGGAEVINFTHWLGAVITSMKVIGTKYTPVRQVIDRAASFINVPTLCFSMVVRDEGLAGLYVGSPQESYSQAADLSARLHIIYVDKPFKQILSVMPRMYDDLWTGAKGMYKLEPVVADGGEVIIYAPHITEVSYTHGKIIDRIGYHTRDYFLKQMERFVDIPGGVMAHSTHLKGIGTYDPESEVEVPRIQVTLATGIPEERCRRINLGYIDPATIVPEEWAGREDEGILLVRKAGEMLYRLRKR